jgi:hypothetical protein
VEADFLVLIWRWELDSESESASELEVLLFVFFPFLMVDVLFDLCFALLLYDTQGRLLDRELFRLLTFSYLRRSESDQTSQFDSKRFDLNVLERGVDCLFSLEYYSVQAFNFPFLSFASCCIFSYPSQSFSCMQSTIGSQCYLSTSPVRISNLVEVHSTFLLQLCLVEYTLYVTFRT